MKISLIFIVIIVGFSSCTKRQNRNAIEGVWELRSLDGQHYSTEDDDGLKGTFIFNAEEEKCDYSMDQLKWGFITFGESIVVDTSYAVGSYTYTLDKSEIILDGDRWFIDELSNNKFKITKTIGGWLVPSYDYTMVLVRL